ncbi:MAG: glutamine-hydrolyzing GMP synthase [bacterium]|nr:glutamine-hydrolyzing GMP synthase [bacterium]
MHQAVIILDFGSQYTKLIARKIRELNVYSVIEPFDISLDELKEREPAAIILSGGPASIYADGAPRADSALFDTGIPILGICYGLQNIVYALGGEVAGVTEREYGPAAIIPKNDKGLLAGVASGSRVWMSHGDRVEKLPPGFSALGTSDNSPYAAISDEERKIYALQFHPEVTHTEYGMQILRNFLFYIASIEPDWTMGAFIEEQSTVIEELVGDGHVLLGLSGGVDSSVLAVLLNRVIGDRVHPVFVDNGLLREGDLEQIHTVLKDEMGLPVTVAEAGELFLKRLAGVAEPEHKRRIIGETFIEVFTDEARRIRENIGDGELRFLAQGTLYPDRIESKAIKGPSDTIKTHHNVGGLPDDLPFELLEPFGELFKDEVRKVGRELGLPEKVVGRHPFPGPSLAVRCPGEVTEEKVAMLRRADAIAMEEIRAAGVYDDIAQALVVLLPVKSVGVMGDERTYEYAAVLRCVITEDFMTADWYRMSHDLLARISARITNEVRGINRLLYDVSSKPPATVEWE